MFPQYGELRRTSGWDRFGSLRHPSKFQRVRVLASLLQRRRSTEDNEILHDVWPSPGLVQYIYIFRGSCPVMEFCQVQNSLCVQVLRTRVVGVSQTFRRWAEGASYIRQGGHHVGRWPTFEFCFYVWWSFALCTILLTGIIIRFSSSRCMCRMGFDVCERFALSCFNHILCTFYVYFVLDFIVIIIIISITVVIGPPLNQVASWPIQPFGRNRYGPKIGSCALLGRGSWAPSNTTWPGPRFTSTPSFILIHPTVWSRYNNVTDRQDRQTTVP